VGGVVGGLGGVGGVVTAGVDTVVLVVAVLLDVTGSTSMVLTAAVETCVPATCCGITHSKTKLRYFPPSTLNIWPVTQFAQSEAKKSTA
jgi:hypothetical protein